MSFKEFSGSMFDSSAQVLVHQVNCMGIMGSGVARQIRDRWPDVYLAYHKAVKALSGNCLGGCLMVQISSDRWIANLFGQYYYRGYKDDDLYLYDEFWKQPELDETGKSLRYTNYEAFYRGLCKLRKDCQEKGLTSLAFPCRIGCDRGGADWSIVKAMIMKVFSETEMEVEIWKL